MADVNHVPEPVVAAVDRFLQIHDQTAPHVIEGLYLVGSVALGDWQSGTSDIDIVAVAADPPDDDIAGALHAAFALVREELPDIRIDGPFLAWGDLSVAPTTGLHRPYVVNGVWHFDAEGFEINPVVWRTLRRQAVVVRGPSLAAVDVYDDDYVLRQWLDANLRGYWRSVHGDLVNAIGEMTEDSTLPAAVIEWCVLGPARMFVTIESGEVVSKSDAARQLIPRVDDEIAVGLQIALDCRARRIPEVGRSDAVLAAAAMGTVLEHALAAV